MKMSDTKVRQPSSGISSLRLLLRASLVVCASLAQVLAQAPAPDGLPPVGSTVIPVNATASSAAVPACANPCFVVKDYWPVKTCKAECNKDVCSRGWGSWQSEAVCCAPGVAFPEGCGQRPTECWVVENYQLRTCIRDDRKCLQGYGIWPNQSTCCSPNAAFPTGCRTDIVRSPQPCWVVDTYFPSRLCRPSDTLCAAESGVQSYPSRQTCCSPGNAFSEGCSANAPQAPCWVVDSYWPDRKCRQEADLAACSRGWGVYQSQDICCAPNVAFPEGCSLMIPASPAIAANVTPAAATALTAPVASSALQASLTAMTAPIAVTTATTAPVAAASVADVPVAAAPVVPVVPTVASGSVGALTLPVRAQSGP